MYSKKLKEVGLPHYIAGAAYNFRVLTVGESIKEQMKTALSEGNLQADSLYSGSQTHSANIEYCDGENGAGFYAGKVFENTDGLITDKPGVALLIKYADCTPIVIYDPIKKVLANLHSGWRGTVQKIGPKAVERMVNDFGSRREDLLVFLGPSIDQAHYQVGEEVYQAFADFSMRDDFFVADGDRYLLSMLEANRSIMLEVGIPNDNIELSLDSTFTSSQLHSSRQEGPNYQLNALIAMIPH